MTEQKLKKIIMLLCGTLIVLYSLCLCITSDLFEAPAYLSALIGAGLVGIPSLYSYRKTGRIIQPIPIILTSILFVGLIGFRYWNWKLGFYSLFNVLWPILCYGAANFIISKIKSNKNIWSGMLLYNIVVVAVICIVQEHWYKFSVTDVIAEVFLYVISQIALFLTIKKYGFGIREITTYIMCNLIFSVIWFFTQERIGEIIASFNYSFTSLDADGGYNNWLAQREYLLKSNIKGEFFSINRMHIYTIISNCPIAYLYSEGYAWLSIIISITVIALSGFMINLSIVSRKNNWLKIVVASIVLKNIIGLISNVFLFYSTSIGIIMMDNIFDIIPIVWILFANKDCFNGKKERLCL